MPEICGVRSMGPIVACTMPKGHDSIPDPVMQNTKWQHACPEENKYWWTNGAGESKFRTFKQPIFTKDEVTVALQTMTEILLNRIYEGISERSYKVTDGPNADGEDETYSAVEMRDVYRVVEEVRRG